MLTSVDSRNQKIVAQAASKSDKPFYCPECNSETILHQGLVKTHHFAHKSFITCQYGQGESDKHRECKQTIYELLLQNKDLVVNCEMEKSLGKVRPDIYFEKHGERIAIEVQVSNLTMEKIIYRTEQYNRLGVNVLWLPVAGDSFVDAWYGLCKFIPKQWEKWLHATYYGRVYYWAGDLDVFPFHFEDVILHKDGWDYGGIPGYEYRSKKYRRLRRGKPVNILQDFDSVSRDAWKGGQILVPSCKLLIDRQEKWWK